MNFTDRAKQAQFAALTGTSTRRVRTLVQDGTLPAGGTYAEWVQALLGRLREAAAGRSEGTQDLRAEQAALARARRLDIEREHKVRCGELLEAAPLRAELGRQFSAVREGLLAIPDRVSGTLLGATQPVIHQTLDAEIRHALASLVGTKS